MWTEGLSCAQRPRTGCVARGTLRAVDLTIAAVQVVMRGDRVVAAALDAQDCSEALRDVVALGDGAVRVDADVVEEGRRCVQLRLMVDAEALDAHMAAGTLRAEVALVQLAMDVWREARVPPPEEEEDVDMMDDDDAPLPPPPPLWRSEHALFAHQAESVRWMRALEARAPCALPYAGNLRMTDAWYVDTERECWTTDASPREAHLAGGVCADGTGTGKTAVVLRLVAEALHDEEARKDYDKAVVRYAARGTLVVLPLNLVAQWQAEVGKFLKDNVRVVWLVQGKDVRTTTLQDLCAADVVFTTSYFLRASKPYADLVEAALGGRPRTRAVFSAWARQPGHDEPLVEAVHWRRVVVDELHQVFESARDLRQLRLLSARVLWGLTATPVLDTEAAQHLYLLLCREKAHHPNLLARLIARGVRGTASSLVAPAPTLRLVQLSAEERMHLQAQAPTRAEDVVKLTTFVDVTDGERAADAASVEAQFRAARSRELATLRAKAAGHERAVAILERAGAELEAELQALAERCAAGDELAAAQAEAARAAAEAHARDLAHARAARDAERAKAARCEASEAFVRERLAALRAQDEACPICLTAACGVITPCAHLFCAPCARKHLARNGAWCPTCRAPLCAADLTGVTRGGGIGTKLAQVGALLASLGSEPVILFVQWKAMLRGVRAYLRGAAVGARVLSLDGNAAQRAATLTEFQRGGVLLLCLEDSFAGLHLPHARHVVFAHAIVGDRARVEHLERQAIARCVRRGQTGEVRVYSFVVADCEEERVWRRTHD